jgi:hypothetical protein
MPVVEGTEIHIIPDTGGQIAVEYVGAWDVMMSRGTEADEIKLLTSRPQEFENIGVGSCTFRFKHNQDGLSGGVAQFEWKGWYMQAIQPNPSRPGLYTVVFRDYRAIAERQRLDLSYNVQWADEYLRADSLSKKTAAVGRKWTCLDAAWDALQQFGFALDRDVSSLETWQKKEILPNNLGNSRGGGFCAASPSEVLPLLLEQIRCDYIMTPEGKARVVGRSSDKDESPKLKLYRLIGGTVAKRNIKWQRPKWIDVLFERYMEGGWDYTATSSRSTGVTRTAMNFTLLNVMPKFDTNNIGDVDKFVELNAQVSTELGSSAAEKIRSRWFKPNLFPYSRDAARYVVDSPETIAKKQWFDDAVRRCWRRVFQVNPAAYLGQEGYVRCFTGIRLGRLEENGGTRSGGNIWMDYCRHLRWGRPEGIGSANWSSSPLGLRFSENRYYAGLRAEDTQGLNVYSFLPAPFTARWLNPERLIFEVQPDRPPVLNSVANLPGVMEEHLNYGNLVELASSSALRRTSLQGAFKEGWNLRVLWNGRLSGPIPDAATAYGSIFASPVQRTRTWRERMVGFPDGVAAPVDVRVEEVTANHTFSNEALRHIPIGSIGNYMPEVLSNKAEIEDVAGHVAEQIRQTYNQDRAGVGIVAGIEALAAKVWTGGAIWTIRLSVGGDGQDPCSLQTEYVVQPEVRPFKAKRKMLAGKQPSIAQDE